MPLQLIQNDITLMKVDAIVNAANETLLGGGGVDGAIHRAAGPGLLEECRGLGGCPTGEAKLTGAYRLPCRYVIHTVGPIWEGGSRGEEQLLRSCYRKSFALAREKGCTSLAFPLISAGVYGYPVREALQVAVDSLSDALAESGSDMLVYLVLFGKAAAALENAADGSLSRFIDQTYLDQRGNAQARQEAPSANRPRLAHAFGFLRAEDLDFGKQAEGRKAAQKAARERPEVAPLSLEADQENGPEAAEACCDALPQAQEAAEACCDALPQAQEAAQACSLPQSQSSEAGPFLVDEGFAAMLLRKIDEKGMTDPQCYKRANIDKKLFSKIRSNPGYRPSKPTVLAFAVALKLSLEETRELLLKAGYALSHSFLLDVIVEYYLRKGVYDIYEINWTLLQNDQPQLGSATD